MKLEIHDLCKFMPEPTKDEYDTIKASIKEHGLYVPINLYQGKIIDGRTRYKACQELGVGHRISDYTPFSDEGALQLVIAQNIQHRHLDSTQRACLACEYLFEFYEKLGHQRIRYVKDSEAVGHNGVMTPRAAKMFGTSCTMVDYGKKVYRKDRKLFNRCKRGEISMIKAIKFVRSDEIKAGDIKWLRKNTNNLDGAMKMINILHKEGWIVEIRSSSKGWASRASHLETPFMPKTWHKALLNALLDAVDQVYQKEEM